MARPPDPHPLHVLRSAEVILVARFAEPAALARRLARRPAGTLRAILLPPPIAHIDGENLPAAQALALYFMGHGSPARRPILAPRRPADVEQARTLTGETKTDAEQD